MSNPRVVLLSGVVLSAAMGLLAVVGVWAEQWVLVALAGAVMAGTTLLVQLDTWRRTRVMRNFLRDEIRQRSGGSGLARNMTDLDSAPAPTQDDVLGAVRLLQAQYTGRLDRLQAAVEQALAQVAPADRPGDTDSR